MLDFGRTDGLVRHIAILAIGSAPCLKMYSLLIAEIPI